MGSSKCQNSETYAVGKAQPHINQLIIYLKKKKTGFVFTNKKPIQKLQALLKNTAGKYRVYQK